MFEDHESTKKLGIIQFFLFLSGSRSFVFSW